MTIMLYEMHYFRLPVSISDSDTVIGNRTQFNTGDSVNTLTRWQSRLAPITEVKARRPRWVTTILLSVIVLTRTLNESNQTNVNASRYYTTPGGASISALTFVLLILFFKRSLLMGGGLKYPQTYLDF